MLFIVPIYLPGVPSTAKSNSNSFSGFFSSILENVNVKQFSENAKKGKSEIKYEK